MLYGHGFRTVFLADDNFTVYRKRAKEILGALRDWNHKQACGTMALSTQVSIESARDPELLQMLSGAGMNNVFIGVETPNQDSLKETRKRQNVGIDLLAQVGKFLDAGITVTAGMIVGFKNYQRSEFIEPQLTTLTENTALVLGVAVRYQASGTELVRVPISYMMHQTGGAWKIAVVASAQ